MINVYWKETQCHATATQHGHAGDDVHLNDDWLIDWCPPILQNSLAQ